MPRGEGHALHVRDWGDGPPVLLVAGLAEDLTTWSDRFVSALVATCAAFAPIFARSIDQGLLRTHVTQADAEQTATAIAWPRTADARDVLPAEVAEQVPTELAAVSGEPVEVVVHGI